MTEKNPEVMTGANPAADARLAAAIAGVGQWEAHRKSDGFWTVRQGERALPWDIAREWQANEISAAMNERDELLAACKILVSYFAGHDPNDIPAECGSGVRDALIAARSAIARAKGGAA